MICREFGHSCAMNVAAVDPSEMTEPNYQTPLHHVADASFLPP
jgi:hypothetical protein